jgi:alpha-galactosidase
VLAGITYLIRKYKEAKIVGLCHGYGGVYRLASALGLEREHITFEIPGVNHFVWLTHFYYKGQNAFPLVDEWIEKEAPTYWETCHPSSGLGPKAVDLYKRFGAFPIGDTCTPGGGTWPWWYHTDAETERQWKEDPHAWWEVGYFPHLGENVEHLIKVSKDTSVRVTDVYPPRKSGEVMVPLVESIACDIPRVLITNIQNTCGFLPGIPRDFEVEIPTLVSKRGIQGIKTDGLPGPLIAYALRDRVAPVEIELEAYEKGSRELLHQLLLMDPWTQSEEQAKNLLEDILALPCHGDMREHYK